MLAPAARRAVGEDEVVGRGSSGASDGEDGRRQTVDDVLRPSSRRDLRAFPSLVRQAFSVVWEADRRQLLLAAALQLAAGLSLAGQLLVLRSLLQSVGMSEGISDLTAVVPELVAFAALLVVVAGAAVAQREQQRLLTESVTKFTAGRVLDVATAVDLVNFDRPSFYDRLERARVNASVRPLQIAQGVIGLLGAGAAIAAVGVTLVVVEPVIAFVIVVGALPSVYMNRLSARVLHAFTVEQTPGDRRRAYLFQILTRKEEAQEIRAFDSQSYLRDEHDRLFDRRIAATRRLVRRRSFYGVVSALIAAAVTVVSIALLLTFVQSGRITVPDAVVAVGAIVLMAGRLRSLISSSGSLYEGALFLGDFTDFVEVGDRHASQRDASEPVPEFEAIELRDVSFTYPSRTEPSLQSVSLTVKKGEVIALVGENGSGKTTLTKLLAGLYRPTEGEILWDGNEISGTHLARLREHVTVIFQDFAQYFLTAHENVAIGRFAQMHDRAAVEKAASMAGADRFLAGLPNGYDSLLGPAFVGGSDLSLGQWQRVALARAYFRNAPLLILDEPTASLDPRGEYEIFRRVRDLAAGNTVLLVSHRFSNVRIADRIVVFEGGRIVEQGSHDDLMATDGVYAELFELQAKGYRRSGY